MPEQVLEGFVSRVRQELAARGYNANTLAGFLGVSESTMSRFFRNRQLSSQLAARICGMFDIDENGLDADVISMHGYKVKDDNTKYIDKWTMVRPRFPINGDILLFPLEIYWREKERKLRIKRCYLSNDKMNFGSIYRNDRNYINIVAADRGYFTLITLSDVDDDGLMFGSMMCLGEQAGTYVPTCAPVAMKKTNPFEAECERVIRPDDQNYSIYKAFLSRVSSQGYAIISPF